MKKNILIITVTAILAFVAIFLITSNSHSTLVEKSRDFAVHDTSNITRIFLADKNNRTVELERQANNSWILNNKYLAQKESVDLLLKTMLKLDVMEPVSDAAHNTVITIMAAASIKVEIYQMVYRIKLFKRIKWFPHEKLTKTYYVGHTTQNNIGTYMLMEDAEKPYIVYIPGFRGSVASRYRTVEKDWRSHTIFTTPLMDIESVSIEFPADPDQSYQVINHEDRYFELIRLKDQQSISHFDTLKVMNMITSFRKINFEALLNDIYAEKRDSLTAGLPAHIITLTKKSQQKQLVKTYYKMALPGEINYKGEPILYDRDRLYALVNDDKDFVLIQYYVFDKITRPLDYFIPEN